MPEDETGKEATPLSCWWMTTRCQRVDARTKFNLIVDKLLFVLSRSPSFHHQSKHKRFAWSTRPTERTYLNQRQREKCWTECGCFESSSHRKTSWWGWELFSLLSNGRAVSSVTLEMISSIAIQNIKNWKRVSTNEMFSHTLRFPLVHDCTSRRTVLSLSFVEVNFKETFLLISTWVWLTARANGKIFCLAPIEKQHDFSLGRGKNGEREEEKRSLSFA